MAEETRVVCTDLLKIYSCIASAAYVTVTPREEIFRNCEGWISYTRNVHKFMYYQDYCKIVPEERRIRQDIRPPVEVHIDIRELSAFKTGKPPGRVYLFYDAISEFLDSTGKWGEIIPLTRLFDPFEELYRKRFPQFKDIFLSVTAFSKNTEHDFPVYERIMGAKYHRVWSKESRRYVPAASFSKVDGMNYEKIAKIPFLLEFGRGRTTGTPVIDLVSSTVYCSISRAAKLNKMSTDLVTWCCEGDFDAIFRKGYPDAQFRYAKLI